MLAVQVPWPPSQGLLTPGRSYYSSSLSSEYNCSSNAAKNILYIMVLSEVTVAEDAGNKKELRHCTELRDLELDLPVRQGSVLEGVPPFHC